MPESCVRCQKPGDAPPAHRIPFAPAVKEKVTASICASCWREWEEMEIKVINEYRYNSPSRSTGRCSRRPASSS